MNAIDQIFKDQKELLELDPRSIEMDRRIVMIRGLRRCLLSAGNFTIISDAVQAKFRLTSEELATVWIPMLESIKSRRRNFKAKLQRNSNQSNTIFSRDAKSLFLR